LRRRRYTASAVSRQQTRAAYQRLRGRVVESTYEMLLNLMYGMLGQILINFGDDPALHIGVERNPQIRKRPRRSYHDERLHLTLAHKLFHCRSRIRPALSGLTSDRAANAPFFVLLAYAAKRFAMTAL
jgi:hypothetical protein